MSNLHAELLAHVKSSEPLLVRNNIVEHRQSAVHPTYLTVTDVSEGGIQMFRHNIASNFSLVTANTSTNLTDR